MPLEESHERGLVALVGMNFTERYQKGYTPCNSPLRPTSNGIITRPGMP
jgi:hypothetical protein